MTSAVATPPRSPGFDVIMGNPPFLNQVENATTVEKGLATITRLVTGDSAVRYTDVSATFLLLGVRLLSEHGRSCLVQPQSLLAAKAAGPVRRDLLSTCSLVGLWVSNEHVFEGVSVFTCAPTLERGGDRCCQLARCHGSQFNSLPVMEIDGDVLRDEISWAPLVADASGVPDVQITAGGTIGDHADSVADFTEYYRLVGFVVEDEDVPPDERDEFPPLITTGLVDLAICYWGERPTRIFKQKWRAPRIDRQRMYRDGTLGRWIDRRRVPKIVMATQTKVIEVIVDNDAEYVASIPLITITPSDLSQIWHLAAALASPVTCALALRQFAGAALNADAIKLSAKQILQLPVPKTGPEWDEAAQALRDAAQTDDEHTRLESLRTAAMHTLEAYQIPAGKRRPLLDWWWSRLVGKTMVLNHKSDTAKPQPDQKIRRYMNVQTRDRLDPRAIERVSGPAWEGLRNPFLELSDVLLAVSPHASAQLTTIYVKYRTNADTDGSVFAVAWLKRSTELVVGLALPENQIPPQLGTAPRGMKYPGLTGYLRLGADTSVPPDLAEWARAAYDYAVGTD